MLTFPTLKTGSTVQYPFTCSEFFANDVKRFLGGDEQRYRTTPTSLHNWTVKLDLLDEAELQEVEALFQATNGSSDTFSFIDPVSGTVFPSCYFRSDSLNQVFKGELQSGTTIVIQESRS